MSLKKLTKNQQPTVINAFELLIEPHPAKFYKLIFALTQSDIASLGHGFESSRVPFVAD